LLSRHLTGEHRRLSDAFEAPLTVVVVAFRREQQATIDRWGPWLSKVASPAGIAHLVVPLQVWVNENTQLSAVTKGRQAAIGLDKLSSVVCSTGSIDNVPGSPPPRSMGMVEVKVGPT